MFACRTHCGQNGLARALWAGAVAPAPCRRSSVACPLADENCALRQPMMGPHLAEARAVTNCKFVLVACSQSRSGHDPAQTRRGAASLVRAGAGVKEAVEC